ncbi:RluA family pseudouridine synthase [Leptospira sp. GIMC2001]|uniref:RluA family pseudouridine synthase n=1 Tax=Leptospira sp. GIMC2001 TaxID=1513297 RepID=UPI00234A29F9|nr:RluA family pseudouridine synthase [Leptospira sp. GIMC2001]WCL49216.1 RluA family pseudouridine synthase [Leptospira sp. GIMC2001]
MELTATVLEEYNDQRLDIFLLEAVGDDLTRSAIQKWIRSECVQLDDKPITKTGHKVYTGEIYKILVPAKPKPFLEPVKMEIPIVWEDEHIRIVHKAPGIATHPGPGDRSITLVNGLLYQFNNLSAGTGTDRPGIVHRLDKPTEGLLVVAKNDRAHAAMAKLFMDRQIHKTYYAWVLQAPQESKGTIDLPIGRHPKERLKMTVREDGRPSITHYETLQVVCTKRGRKFSFVKIQLETGRTHQIRVHFQHIGCPVVGDLLYSRSGNDYKKYGLLLLARTIQFVHPFTQEEISAEIPLPTRFLDFEKNCVNIF